MRSSELNWTMYLRIRKQEYKQLLTVPYYEVKCADIKEIDGVTVKLY